MVKFMVIFGVTLAAFVQHVILYFMEYKNNNDIVYHFNRNSNVVGIHVPSSTQTKHFPFYHLLVRDEDTEKVTPVYFQDFGLALLPFFDTSFAMIIFRLYGRNIITTMVHGLLHLVVFVALVLRLFLVFDYEELDYVKEFHIPIYLLLVFYAIQCLLAFYLVIFPPADLTPLQKENRIRVHAFLGFITFVVLLWNFILHISKVCSNHVVIRHRDAPFEPWPIVAMTMAYVMFIMYVLLNPLSEETESS